MFEFLAFLGILFIAALIFILGAVFQEKRLLKLMKHVSKVDKDPYGYGYEPCEEYFMRIWNDRKNL